MVKSPIEFVATGSSETQKVEINMTGITEKPVVSIPESGLGLYTTAATAGTAVFSAARTIDSGESSEDFQYHYNLGSALEGTKNESVGLGCLPIQKKLQAFRKGATFTILLAGESGVGKTSFINTLFDSELIPLATESPASNFTNKELVDLSMSEDTFEKKTTKIKPYRMDLVENGFTMRCSVIDTPGFGDYINNKYCWYPITRYIDEQYRRLAYQENQPNRVNLVHNEVHVCLYFIKPTGKTLTTLDLEAMRNLASRVNLIPIIAKADAFSREELASFKLTVQQAFKQNGIEICQFIKDSKKAANVIQQMPLTIINSNGMFKNSNGKLVRGREYPWGLAEVENPDHCEFLKLREFLLGTHMGDLIISTEEYYENYRRDFMKFRLSLTVQRVLAQTELESLGLHIDANYENKETDLTSARTKRSWKSATLREAKDVQAHISPESLNRLTETQDSITILKLIDKISLTETEKELVLLNPAYMDMEQFVKQKFTADVKKENQRFKSWKRTLFERQDKFNQDIDQLHQRVKALQLEILKYSEQVK
ncbi:hypothetical protein HII13_004117 [Brettanomyces bruxellensis]|nr:hypothetical protein HII13_004117 [Brettanomyces bruxellensis]